MPNKHIDEFLDYYIKLENPQYAVLLKGKWGSGKTHFINSYKTHLEEIEQKYIYVSLYGVTSYDEIETKFLQSINPKVFNEKALLAGKVAQAFVNNKVINSFKILGKFYSKLNSDGKILIFDDIERCSINIVDLLGYINYFVEHQSYKVILIANEEELEKTDKNKNTNKYKAIKEKLIGKTFEFTTNVNQAYNSFLKELKDEEILKKYENTIIEVFEKSGCNNLRLLRQGLFDFKRLYELVLKNHVKKEELIRDFIELFFIFVFETRSGYCETIRNLTNNSKNHWEKFISNEVADSLGVEKDEDKELIADKVYEKYKVYINHDIILDVLTWEELIEDSYIDRKKIGDELFKSKYYIDENTESWKRLWSFIKLDDDNFDEVFYDVVENLKGCKYTDLSQVMLISSTILDIKRQNLTTKSLDELYDILKKQIDYLFENKLIEKKSILNENYIKKHHPSYDHLGFDIDFLEYEEIKQYIDDKVKKEKEIIFKSSYSEIENALKTKFLNLYTLLSHENNSEVLYNDKPIFAFMDMDKLAKLLVTSPSDAQYAFGGIIEDRYKYDFFASKLEDEFKNIYKLKDFIEKEVKTKEGKISGYRLKINLLKPFEKVIEDIEKYKNNKKKDLDNL